MLLFIIRHGQPIYEPDSLTDVGMEQARALVERFRINGLTGIYASPLNRAQMTARPTAEALGLPIQTEAWMSEQFAYDNFHIDLADGSTTWLFHKPHRFFNNDLAAETDPDVIYGEFSERIKAGIKSLGEYSDDFLRRLGYRRDGAIYRAERPNDDRIACFCHEGLGLAWLSHLMSLPLNYVYTHFGYTHSGVTTVSFASDESGEVIPRLLGFSDISHILSAGLEYYHSFGDVKM